MGRRIDTGQAAGRHLREAPAMVHNEAMTRKPPGHEDASAGTVKWFDADEGWGVIEAAEVPGGCFVHFSNVETAGYRQLHAGQQVHFTFEQPGFLQDGYSYRALAVWPGELTS